MNRLNICRHNLLRRSCETCDLEEDVKQLKNALEQIAQTSGKSMVHTFTKDGHKKCVEIAEIILGEI